MRPQKASAPPYMEVRHTTMIIKIGPLVWAGHEPKNKVKTFT